MLHADHSHHSMRYFSLPLYKIPDSVVAALFLVVFGVKSGKDWFSVFFLSSAVHDIGNPRQAKASKSFSWGNFFPFREKEKDLGTNGNRRPAVSQKSKQCC